MRLTKQVLALLPALAMAALAAVAGEAGKVSVTGAWARATPEGAKNGAAYVVLKGGTGEADTLVGGSSPVAGVVEVHTHLEEDGVMKMRRVEKLAVAPGSTQVFAPGGLHLMLMNLTAPLKEGTSFPLTLKFEKAGDISVDVAVAGIGAAGPAGAAAGTAASGARDGSHDGSHDGKGSDHGKGSGPGQ